MRSEQEIKQRIEETEEIIKEMVKFMQEHGPSFTAQTTLAIAVADWETLQWAMGAEYNKGAVYEAIPELGALREEMIQAWKEDLGEQQGVN